MDEKRETKLLREIAERLSKATSGSRELSCSVAKAVGWVPEEGMPGSNTSSPWAWCPDFSESIDAALALVDRMAPECCVLVGDYKGLANPTVWGGKYQLAKGYASLSPNDDACSSWRAHAETPPLAVLLALVTGLALVSEPSQS